MCAIGFPPASPCSSVGSSTSVSRATTPGTRGRTDVPSGKKWLGLFGSYRGWSCMSTRQPELAAMSRTARAVALDPRLDVLAILRIDVAHRVRPELFEKLTRLLAIEERILGLDAEEEPVAARQREARRVEHGMVRHRQRVQGEHAE